MSDSTNPHSSKATFGVSGPYASASFDTQQVVVEQIAAEEFGNDGPLFLLAANGENGLETQVVDVRAAANQAFAPRSTGPRTVTDTASFLAEVARRPLAPTRSTVWANRGRGTITAVYDDLDPSLEEDYTDRGDHLTLKFVPDPDWAILLAAADGKYHGQIDFADLIEQAGHLITSHSGADLMEMVHSIRTSSKGEFLSDVSRDAGSQTVVYSEEVSATAGTAQRPLEVPREITFTARPFEDYPTVTVPCWLRLQTGGGRLSIGLFPKPYHHLVRNAWTSVVEDLSTELDRTIYAANL